MKTRYTRAGPELRIGVDTGGTFTDFVAFCGTYRTAFKLASTPDAPAEAILTGIEQIINDPALSRQVTPSNALQTGIAHGTTVATNALLEQKGARTALITTAGFEDVLEIGRQARPDLYNLNVTKAPPLVPRSLRFGVTERTGPDGRIIKRLAKQDLVALRKALLDSRIESIAVSLLFSFANPLHEQSIARALESLGVPISISHQILPEYREYERTSTVVANAYLAPRVGKYLMALRVGLDRVFHGANQPSVRIMQSSGGAISAEIAASEPVRTILSGPAGGVVASLRIAELAGLDRVITFDMGGTSTDVALCSDGARTTNESQLAGLPIAIPVLDIHTVGAGGGSIATVDRGGALRVGPESAGADPGPACYGKGTLPTVTDANLVLGRFGPEARLAGEMKLDLSRARLAIDELARELSVASRRRVNGAEAALGIARVTNVNMERALRLVSVERGYDPRQFTLVSFGGAGGLHATALAETLKIPRVLVPAEPGNFSALGVLLADVVRDYSRTVMIALPRAGALPTSIAVHFAELKERARVDLESEGFSGSRTRLVRSLAARYRGQSFELEIPLVADPREAFHRVHRERYGHADPEAEMEIVSIRLRAIGLTTKPRIQSQERVKRRFVKSDRVMRIRVGRGGVMADVFDRGRLSVGSMVRGPAVIMEYGSTTLLPPGWRLEVDEWRNLILEPRN